MCSKMTCLRCLQRCVYMINWLSKSEEEKEACLGSGQSARLLLRRSEFESRWRLQFQFFCKVVFEKNVKKQKRPRLAYLKKKRKRINFYLSRNKSWRNVIWWWCWLLIFVFIDVYWVEQVWSFFESGNIVFIFKAAIPGLFKLYFDFFNTDFIQLIVN